MASGAKSPSLTTKKYTGLSSYSCKELNSANNLDELGLDPKPGDEIIAPAHTLISAWDPRAEKPAVLYLGC